MDEAIAMFALLPVLFFGVLGVDWAGDRAGGAGRVESAARDSAFVLLEDPAGDAAAAQTAEDELRGRVALTETCESVAAFGASRSAVGAAQEAAVWVDGCELSSGWVFDDLVDAGAVCGWTEAGWAIGRPEVTAEPLVWCETNSW